MEGWVSTHFEGVAVRVKTLQDYQSPAGEAGLGLELNLARALAKTGFLVLVWESATHCSLSQGEEWDPALGRSQIRNTFKDQRQKGPRLTMICVWTAAPLTPRAQEPPFHSKSGPTSQWHCPAQANHSPGSVPTGIPYHLALAPG